MPRKKRKEIADWLYIEELRRQLIGKILSDWNNKWSSHFEIERDIVDNRHGFANALRADIETNLKQGKTKAEINQLLPGIHTFKRFLDPEHKSDFPSIKECIAIYIGYSCWENFKEKCTPAQNENHINYQAFKEKQNDHQWEDFNKIADNSNMPVHITNGIYLPFLFTSTEYPAIINNPDSEVDDVDFTLVKPVSVWKLAIAVIILILLIIVAFRYFRKTSITQSVETNVVFADSILKKIKFSIIDTSVNRDKASHKIMQPATVYLSYQFPKEMIHQNIQLFLPQIDALPLTVQLAYLVDTTILQYHWPCVENAELRLNGKVVKTLNYIVPSNGWQGWTTIYNRETEKKYRLGNHYYLRKNMITKGVLRIPPIDSVAIACMYWSKMLNIGSDFNLSADSFVIDFKAKVIPVDSEDKGDCLDTEFTVYTSNFNNIRIRFVNPGCLYWSNLKIAEVTKNGKEDLILKSLASDFSEWKKVRLKVVKGVARLSIEGQQVLEIPYSEPLGKIIGLEFVYRGFGQLDYVHLQDTNNRMVWRDEFEK